MLIKRMLIKKKRVVWCVVHKLGPGKSGLLLGHNLVTSQIAPSWTKLNDWKSWLILTLNDESKGHLLSLFRISINVWSLNTLYSLFFLGNYWFHPKLIYQDYFEILIANFYKKTHDPMKTNFKVTSWSFKIKTWKWMWNSFIKMWCNVLTRPNLRLQWSSSPSIHRCVLQWFPPDV